MTESEILHIWNGPTSVCNKAKILKFAGDYREAIVKEIIAKNAPEIEKINAALAKGQPAAVSESDESAQERKAREKADQFAAEETLRCLEAEQRAAELQARLDRVEAALRELVEAEWMVSHDWGGDRHSVLDKAVAALAAAGGQTESAADKLNAIISDGNTLDCKPPFSFNSDGVLNAADPALPGLEILASHSGKSQNREWHSVGTWLYPGEAIYEGTLK